MFKSFSDLAAANAKFHTEHPTASTVIAVTVTIAALVVVNSAAKLAASPKTINIYYPKA